MGGAAASETLIGGYICTIGGAAPLKNSLERILESKLPNIESRYHSYQDEGNEQKGQRCPTMEL